VVRLLPFLLAFGLACALPVSVSAAVRTTERMELPERERAKYRHTIRGLRAILRQMREFSCRLLDDERWLEQTLAELEQGYRDGRPFPHPIK
jgi:hypothetical protein